MYKDLRSFIDALEACGELVRITEEVDPNQEITVIQHRVLAAGGPALLFENVKGSSYRIVSNLYGSSKRVAMVFGRDPQEIGEEIAAFLHKMMPPTPRSFWQNRKRIFMYLNARLKEVRYGPVMNDLIEPARLDALPVLTCWPLDGGAFFTLPLVHTVDPETGAGNLGIYRMQRYDASSTGMHWQIEKGGGSILKKRLHRIDHYQLVLFWVGLRR